MVVNTATNFNSLGRSIDSCQLLRVVALGAASERPSQIFDVIRLGYPSYELRKFKSGCSKRTFVAFIGSSTNVC